MVARMSESWNEKIIAEFRDNDGHVGGNFEGSPLVLLHSTGAKSGIRTDTIRVRARELSGDERTAVWEEQKRRFPGFADYEQQTTRTIPVLLLTRR